MKGEATRGMLRLVALRCLAAVPAIVLAAACGGRTLTTATDDGGAETSPGVSSNPSVPSDWDGGLLPPTSPGTVRCGATTCGPDDQCCLVEDGDPASNGCDSRSSPTCNGTQDEVCCYEVFTSPPATLGSRCIPLGEQDVCAGSSVACGSDADCDLVGAPACVAQRCRGDILQTCGLLPSAMCPP